MAFQRHLIVNINIELRHFQQKVKQTFCVPNGIANENKLDKRVNLQADRDGTNKNSKRIGRYIHIDGRHETQTHFFLLNFVSSFNLKTGSVYEVCTHLNLPLNVAVFCSCVCLFLI